MRSLNFGETVKRDTVTLVSAPEADNVDPFADIEEDEEELEENEVPGSFRRLLVLHVHVV